MMKHLRLARRFISLNAPAGSSRAKIGAASAPKGTEGVSTTSTPFRLPEPTWSVQDLELSKQHPPISEVELEKLAKRALLDLYHLDESTRNDLRQDLGNMMHMIEQVKSFRHNDKDIEWSDSDIYDKPRGVTAAPLRKDADTSKDTEAEHDPVWEKFLKPQTTKVGAHDYFIIETKRESK
jgi:Asp-tRNA(Asn)/Glu-tRNA(Gln) amidotransferase C subunit